MSLARSPGILLTKIAKMLAGLVYESGCPVLLRFDTFSPKRLFASMKETQGRAGLLRAYQQPLRRLRC